VRNERKGGLCRDGLLGTLNRWQGVIFQVPRDTFVRIVLCYSNYTYDALDSGPSNQALKIGVMTDSSRYDSVDWLSLKIRLKSNCVMYILWWMSGLKPSSGSGLPHQCESSGALTHTDTPLPTRPCHFPTPLLEGNSKSAVY